MQRGGGGPARGPGTPLRWPLCKHPCHMQTAPARLPGSDPDRCSALSPRVLLGHSQGPGHVGAGTHNSNSLVLVCQGNAVDRWPRRRVCPRLLTVRRAAWDRGQGAEPRWTWEGGCQVGQEWPLQCRPGGRCCRCMGQGFGVLCGACSGGGVLATRLARCRRWPVGRQVGKPGLLAAPHLPFSTHVFDERPPPGEHRFGPG